MTPHLPTETLNQIALYLPRRVLKSLLDFQPHPFGQIASYLYFSTLSLHFGVRDFDRYEIGWGESPEAVALREWHDKRSHSILMTIVEDDNFAKRIQTLKIYCPGLEDADTLVFQMGLLNWALPKMTRLRVLECNGLLMPLRMTISKLPETVPLLKKLHLGDSVNRQIISSPSDARIHCLSHLEHLTLCTGWQDHLSLTDLPKDLEASSIKKLHITCPRQNVVFLTRYITPALISILTHLSLKIVYHSESPFEIPLQYGISLQSLRIQAPRGGSNSQPFRRHAHALPSLTEFGIYLHDDLYGLEADEDEDFFPAVCDFLRPKTAQLVHLELRAPTQKAAQDRLGFNGGKECWALLKGGARSGAADLLSKLESLSMTLPEGNKSFSLHYSKLIPKRVTRLSLSGYQLADSSVKHIFRVSRTIKGGPSWPPDLRVVCLNSNPTTSSDDGTLARMVAECIVSVRVVKFLTEHCHIRGFWSVSRGVISRDGNVDDSREAGPSLVSCKQWDSREMTAMRAEMLDRYDCEDTWHEVE